MAIRVTGKHAMIARAIMPKKIRIELVVSFILHLQVVLLMDGTLNRKVPRLRLCYRTVTANSVRVVWQVVSPPNMSFYNAVRLVA